jgi:hypothetical protein
MRVQELFEDDEADLPIIYDIISTRLAAGKKVLLNTKNGLHPIEVLQAYDEEDGEGPEFSLWWSEPDGSLEMRFDTEELKKWKVSKKDDVWVLTV